MDKGIFTLLTRLRLQREPLVAMLRANLVPHSSLSMVHGALLCTGLLPVGRQPFQMEWARPSNTKTAPGIRTAKGARSESPRLVRLLSLLRRPFLRRLEWKDVHWDEKLLEVPSLKSKTASRRFVSIRENLASWLEPYRGRIGMICPSNLYARLVADRRAARISDWPANGLRHSFASYHLAHFRDPRELALVQPWYYHKIIPCIKIGRLVRFRLKDVEKALNRHLDQINTIGSGHAQLGAC